MKSSCLLRVGAFLISMILIIRNIDSPITNSMYLTLSENQVSATTWYHFKFTHRVTKDEVTIYLENISTKSNFQKFEIESDEFDDVDTGYFTYEVKAANNNGTAIVGGVLESGYMFLKDNTAFSPTKYNEQSNNFKTYNG